MAPSSTQTLIKFYYLKKKKGNKFLLTELGPLKKKLDVHHKPQVMIPPFGQRHSKTEFELLPCRETNQ
jgi:hypothetical protein